MGTIRFEGKQIQVPDDATEEEIRAIINTSSGFDTDKRLLDTIERHEGYREWVYRDTSEEEFLTVGIGFNLERRGAFQTLNRVLGFNKKQFQELKDGKRGLDRTQARELMREDVASAKSDATALFDTFSTQPRGVQEVLINMAFNLGRKKLGAFKGFREAIDNKKYNKATFEMLNNKHRDGSVSVTPWATQVKGRALELAASVHSFGPPESSGGMSISDFITTADTLTPGLGQPQQVQQAQQAPEQSTGIPQFDPTKFTLPQADRNPEVVTDTRKAELEATNTPESEAQSEARQLRIRKQLGIGEFAAETRAKNSRTRSTDTKNPAK